MKDVNGCQRFCYLTVSRLEVSHLSGRGVYTGQFSQLFRAGGSLPGRFCVSLARWELPRFNCLQTGLKNGVDPDQNR